jgi:uncharacterized protein (DUF58 family)
MPRTFFRKLFRSNRIFPRKLKFTREGKIIVMLAFGLGFAAINTGNNLLYLSFSLLLSLIIISGILSEQTLKKIEVLKLTNPVFFAGSSSSMLFRIMSRKKKLTTRSLETAVVFDENDIMIRAGFCMSLKPGMQKEVAMHVRFPRRGEYISPGLRLSTRFPFSFFRKSIFFQGNEKYLVYPAIISVNELEINKIATGNEDSFTGIGRGFEYFSVRESQPGDDPHAIHWKLTAKKERLMVREFQAMAERRVTVMILNFVYDETAEQYEKMEHAISYSASACLFLLNNGYSVGLKTLFEYIEPSGSTEQAFRILNLLGKLAVIKSDQAGVMSLLKTGNRQTENSDSVAILPSYQDQISLPEIRNVIVV